MNSEQVTFQSGTNTLHGTIDWNEAKDPPTILSIHGSRPGDRNSITYLTPPLVSAGFSCFRFDLSGHGDSTGAQDSNVRQFVDDAIAALAFVDKTRPLTIIGSSMGGHIAVELLTHAHIANLVLLCPALYSAEAYEAPYDVRSQWLLKDITQDAPVLKKLDDFKGRLLHIFGLQDTVIPRKVTELFHTRMPQAAEKDFIVIPDAPHALRLYLAELEHVSEKEMIVQKIIRLLTTA